MIFLSSFESDSHSARSIARMRDELGQIHSASFGWALRCCDQHHDRASDVLQTAYLRVLSGAARFEGRASVRTWFFGVIRVVSLEQRRKRLRPSASVHGIEELQRKTPPHARAVHEYDEARLLAEALTKLSDRQREVLHLVFYEEMTLKDAAEVIGIGLGAASTHYDRGKKALLALLAEKGVVR